MGYQTDTRVSDGSFELITGFRSSASGGGAKAKNTCDIIVTLYDPFDFTVDYRTKWVKILVPKVSRSGQKYYKKVRTKLPYPFYTFVKKSRTVKEWRFVLKAGLAAIYESKQDVPQIRKVIGWAQKALSGYGDCRIIPPRPVDVQNNCTHYKFTIDDFPTKDVFSGFAHGIHTDSYTSYERSLYKSPYGGSFIGKRAGYYDADATNFNIQLEQGSYYKPISVLFSDTAVSTLTAMLWPSSGDMEDIKSQPLIDVAEMVADGAYPLGPPPSAEVAHQRMVRNAMSDNMFGYLTDIVDFSANSWLWGTLVVQPVVQSAIGLSTSVKANDLAIDIYNNSVQSGQWQKGKNIRVFGRVAKQAAECFGCPTEFESSAYFPLEEDGSMFARSTTKREITYNKFEGNASFVYRVNPFNADIVNSSAMRLGQFFNRFATSFDTVLHNLIPLSFVYDWFSSEYTGILNLKDKVYLPVSEWKLIVSFKTDFEIKGECEDIINESYRKLVYGSLSWPSSMSDFWLSYSENWVRGHPPARGYYIDPPYRFNETMERVETSTQTSQSKETHEFYMRQVFINPPRRTDFSDDDVGLECLDTAKLGALEDTGKLVTLGALIWGVVPGS